MRISTSFVTLELASLGDRELMLARLSGFGNPRHIVDNWIGDPMAFFAILCRAGESRFGVGIVQEQGSLPPELFVDRDHLFLGCNREVRVFQLPSGSEAHSVPLDGFFYEFIPATSLGLMVVVHEIGIVGLELSGRPKWSFSRDLISTCVLRGDRLEVCHFDSPSVTLDVKTGNEIKQ